jgi:Mn-containing catalase
MGEPRFAIGKIAPIPGLVDQFFNDSTGQGDQGEIDARGPWNEGDQWEFVEAPAFHETRETVTDSPSIHAESSEPTDADMIQELLVDQLRDILHAEKQVLKALPKMAKAARSQQLQQLFETHLEETEAKIERLNECFGLLDIQPRAKTCKGMMGIVEEGDEVWLKEKRKTIRPPTLR